MKGFRSLGMVLALAGAVLVGSVANGYSQETMMKKVGETVKTGAEKTVSGTKKGYSKGKRIGHTIGSRTWTGTKWVASNTWKGGKWVAVKTANGSKWVYRKATGRRSTPRP